MIQYQAVVIGASSGGFQALKEILIRLSPDFEPSIIIVIHRHRSSSINFEQQLNQFSPLEVHQASQQQPIKNATIYIAPPNYHLLIEEDHTFSLSVERHINFARPSIDVTFESAADVYQNRLVGIILTGANNDGSAGLKEIKKKGGLTIAQTPESAEITEMPKAAIDLVSPHKILPLE